MKASAALVRDDHGLRDRTDLSPVRQWLGVRAHAGRLPCFAPDEQHVRLVADLALHKSAPSPMSTRNCGHSNSAATEQRSKPVVRSVQRLYRCQTDWRALRRAKPRQAVPAEFEAPPAGHQMAVIRQPPPAKKISQPSQKMPPNSRR